MPQTNKDLAKGISTKDLKLRDLAILAATPVFSDEDRWHVGLAVCSISTAIASLARVQEDLRQFQDHVAELDEKGKKSGDFSMVVSKWLELQATFLHEAERGLTDVLVGADKEPADAVRLWFADA